MTGQNLAPQSSGARIIDLPPDHYRVHVAYAPLPSFAELEKEFGKGNVSYIFDGRAWELHSSCADMTKTPGEKVFFLHDVGRDWEREEQIVWGLAQRTAAAPNGYRPATPEEAYEFQKAHPAESLDYVALASVARDGIRRGYVGVWFCGGQRVWDDDWLAFNFDARHRVLFVSRVS